MSQMPSSYENSDVQLYQEPDRTSVMAILSMIFGIGGCCFGLTSILAIPLAIFGIIGIKRSNGRTGGMGFAIAGLIVGLLTLALWIGLFFGIGGAMRVGIAQFGSTTENIFADVQGGDYDSVRAAMIPLGSDTTDAELAAFYAAYKADLGEYVGLPSGIGELFTGYGAVGQQIQQYNGRPGYVPMPVRFDSGWVLVIYVMDVNNSQGSQSGSIPPPKLLMLIGSDGTEYTIPPDAGDFASANRPEAELSTDPLPGDSGEEQTPDDENADDSGEEDPEGP